MKTEDLDRRFFLAHAIGGKCVYAFVAENKANMKLISLWMRQTFSS